MNQQAYNNLLHLMHRYNDNKEFVSTHSAEDSDFSTCQLEIDAVDYALKKISEKDKLAATMLREMQIDGGRIRAVAKKHHKTMQDAMIRMSHSMVDFITTAKKSWD